MAVTKDQLLIEITTNSAKAAQGIDDVSKSLSRLEQQSVQSNAAQQKTSRSLTDMGAIFTKVAAGIIVAEKVFQGLKTVYMATVAEFQKSQDNIQKLGNALAIMGEKNIPQVVESYKKLADQLEDTAAVDGEQIMQLATLGVSMGRTDEQIRDLIQASVGLAAVTERDLNSSFQTLVMSYRGVTRGLKDVIPEVGKFTDGQLKQGAAVKLVAKELAQFATAAAQTYEGQLKLAQLKVGAIMEEIGHIISAGFDLTGAAFGLNEAVGTIKNLLESIAPVASGIIAGVRAAVMLPLKSISWAATQIISFILKILSVVELINKAVPQIGLGDFSSAIGNLKKDIDDLSLAILKSVEDPFDAGKKVIDDYHKLRLQRIANETRKRKEAESEVSELAKQKLEELEKLRKDYENQAKNANASEIQQIYLQRDANIQALDAIKEKLEAEMAYSAVAKENYERAVAAAERLADIQVDKKVLDTLTNVVKETESLTIQRDQYIKATQDIIDMRARANLREIDDEIRKLSIDREKNALSIQSLETRKKLIEEISELEKRREPGREYQDMTRAGTKIGQDVMAAMTTGTMGVINGAVSAFTGVTGVLQGYIDAAQAAVDAIPRLINSVAQLIESFVDLPLRIAEAYNRLFSAITKYFSSYFQNILNGFRNILNGLVRFSKELPAAILKTLDEIPSMALELINDLPALVEEFVINFERALPEILVKIVEVLITKMPEIAVKLAYALQVRIPVAIYHGMLEGLKSWGRVFQRLMRGEYKDIGKIDINVEKLKQRMERLTQDTNRIFAVSAIEPAAKNAQDQVSKIIEAAKKAGRTLFDTFLEKWRSAVDWFRKAGGWISEGFKQAAAEIGAFGTLIWNSLKTGLETIGEWGTKLWNGFKAGLDTIGDAGTQLWQGFKSGLDTIAEFGMKLWLGMVPGLNTIGDWGTKLWNSFAEAAKQIVTIGASLGTSLGQSLSISIANNLPALLNVMTTMIQNIGVMFQKLFKLDFTGAAAEFRNLMAGVGSEIANSIRSVINPVIDVFNGFVRTLNGLRIPEIGYNISMGKFGSWKGALIPETDLLPGEIPFLQKFARGGLVTGPGGLDNIPAMLSAGEFVMNRGAVNAIGLDNLRLLNSGKTPQGNQVNNYSIDLKINTTERLDDNYIRQRLMPTIREELKRGSLDGRAVVYSSGVRR